MTKLSGTICMLGCLATLAAQAALPDPHYPSLDTRVVRNALLAHDGVLYLGGDFHTIAGQPRHGLAAIDIKTGQLLPWAPQVSSGTASALAWKDGLIYVGGSFKKVQGERQAYLAAFSDAKAGEAEWVAAWRPDLDEPVADILAPGTGMLYVGGRFSEAGGQARKNLAEFEDALHGPGRVTAFDPEPDGRVTSLGLDPRHPEALIVSGFFRHVGPAPRALMARVDRASGQPLPGALEVGGGPNREILRSVEHDGVFYAVGVEIASINGQPRSNAFAVDPADLSLKPWKLDLDAGAGAISAWGDRVIVGGDFGHANGLPRRGVALADAQSGQLQDFDPQADHNTYGALLMDGLTVISGYWEHLNGKEQGHLAVYRLGNFGPLERPQMAFWSQP